MRVPARTVLLCEIQCLFRLPEAPTSNDHRYNPSPFGAYQHMSKVICIARVEVYYSSLVTGHTIVPTDHDVSCGHDIVHEILDP
jgi:hypothetical protein